MKKNIFLWSAVILSIVFTSCSNEPDKQNNDAVNSTANNKNLTEIDTAAPITKLTLDATGNTMEDMEYVQKELTVKSGTTVQLTLNNLSTDGAMKHNVVLIEDGEADKVGSFAMQAGPENEFVPNMPEVLAFTKMLEPGESTEITFRAPTPGKYMYICTYPGHYAKMQGVFIVIE